MIDFNRKTFYPINKSLQVNKDEISFINYIDVKITSNFVVSDISSINYQRENSILFINKGVKLNYKINNKNEILIITDDIDIFKSNLYKNIILVSDINLTYNKIVNYLFIHEDNINFKDEFNLINNSHISKFASIDPSSSIGNNCIIGRGCIIDKNCIIKNNVVIKNSIISNNVIINDNSTIGSSGFGFSTKNMGSSNINPQIGIVHIDENVNIGSNCTIDRGKIDFTYVGKNSMIDNLVHIAHNVILGKNATIAAQTGISGSVIIGDNLLSGGQVGFAGHIKIGNNVIIAAKSGVTKNIKDNSIVAGFPAIDIKEWKKNIIKNRR